MIPALAPRIVERRGVPSHPGRGKLLRFPRPVGLAHPPKRLRPHTKDILAISAFVAVCSGLLVAAGASELQRAEEADQLLEPGERWPALRDALTPEMRDWCRGER